MSSQYFGLSVRILEYQWFQIGFYQPRSSIWNISATSKWFNRQPRRNTHTHLHLNLKKVLRIKLIIVIYLNDYLLLTSLTQFRFRNPLNFSTVLNEHKQIK